MRNNYIKKTLSNGVKLYLFLDKNMKKYYVDYGVDYGSNGKWHKFYFDEKYYEVLPGCAHFLEHMLGEHSKYGNIYNYFASKKYQVNASTSLNITHYFFLGIEDIKDSIAKLINIVDDPAFTEDDVEETKYAIIEETKRPLNNKVRVGGAIVARNIYKDLNQFAESYCTIGTEETTKKLDYQTLKLCYDAFYYDANKTLVIAGNFEEDEITNYVEEVYSTLKKHPKRLREVEYKELEQKKTEEEIYYMTTNEDFYNIGFKQKNSSFSRKEINYFLSFMIETKLSDECAFIRRLKNNNIISTIFDYNITFVDDEYYYFEIMANAKDSKKFKNALLKELKKDNFKDKDYELFIRDTISNQIYSSDNKYARFSRLFPKKHYSDDFDDVDFLKDLTFERFKEFYQILDFDDYTISIIRDKNEAH